MYLKTSNKKQLAAAVTLAVMGMAWVAVPSQVWAADGGSQDHPRQYSSYTADSDRAIAIAREQKTGEDMYAASVMYQLVVMKDACAPWMMMVSS